MKNIAVLGSTGSIGTQTLEIVRNNPDLQVVALAAGSSVDLIEAQIREFAPKLAAMWSEEAADELRSRVADLPVKVVAGMDGLLEIAVMPESQVLVTAIVGMIGIRPTIAAIEAGKDIALANKETLVTAGHIIMPLAKEKGVSILPVDSEHSAIFQCLEGNEGRPVKKILLTASGGPFRGYSLEELEKVTLEQALKHPKWTMGAKITIDSATMMNKGLEVIEAKWLFGVEADDIQILVHPQSIVHSAVEFMDTSVIAQLGVPDMKIPISLALGYPDRLASNDPSLDFFGQGANLTFEKPDPEVFKCIRLAYDAIKAGGSYPAALNGANEVLVDLFLKKQIRFIDIQNTLERILADHKAQYNLSLEDVLEIDSRVRQSVKEYLG